MPTRWIPTASLVRRLLADQFPQWAGLPIERFESSGTDNAIYRLGKEYGRASAPHPRRHRHHRQGAALVAEAGTAAAGRDLPATRERLARAWLSLALVGVTAGWTERA